ncbi:MAG: WecB/TagA/CpsF family glycosyltransferase [Cytophagales bacterium]|nr:WecB/TagA/CpsF family glycosyltransferase [Cytophagales bacterium]
MLNIEVDNLDWQQALAQFKTARFIVTPNIDHLYNLRMNEAFYRVYKQADLVLCDSKILSVLSRYFFSSALQQIAGSDYFPAVCRHYRNDPDVRIFLLGGTTPEHSRRAYEGLKRKYNAPVVGYYSPSFGFEHDPAQIEDIIAQVEASGATAVAVGLGSPKQELLIELLMARGLKVNTYMAIGATIDFESGLVTRAPKVFTRMGLEWFYRFVQEPKRLFRRYFVKDPMVLFWIVRQSRLFA